MARPRGFQPDAALDRIQRRFWAHGYHGTSMQDLEAATGLKKQSLYREFGSKDGMYARALQLYADREIAKLAEVVLEGPDAARRFGDLFAAVLEPVERGDRSGCFLCNSAIDRAGEDAATQRATQAGIAATGQLFGQALSVSQPYRGDPDRCRDRALVLCSGYFGLRVMVRGGTALAQLRETAEVLVAGIRAEMRPG